MLEVYTKSIRSQLRDWLEPRMVGVDDMEVADLLPDAVEDLSQDGEFVQQFLEEELLTHLSQVARQIMAEGRLREGPAGPVVRTGGSRLQTQAAFDREVALKETGKFAGVWDHANGKYVRFVTMTKGLLEASLGEDLPRLRTERIDRRFKLMVKAALPDESSLVGEVFDGDQLEEMWSRAAQDVNREMNREEKKYD